MTLDTIYFFIVVPMIALLAGWAAIVSTQRSADRLRAAEADRRRAAQSRTA